MILKEKSDPLKPIYIINTTFKLHIYEFSDSFSIKSRGQKN